MDNLDRELLGQIAQRTESDLILFFVIVAVLLPVVILAVYKLIKHRHQVECSRRAQDMERERNLLQVITGNTEAMCGLRISIEQLALGCANKSAG